MKFVHGEKSIAYFIQKGIPAPLIILVDFIELLQQSLDCIHELFLMSYRILCNGTCRKATRLGLGWIYALSPHIVIQKSKWHLKRSLLPNIISILIESNFYSLGMTHLDA